MYLSKYIACHSGILLHYCQTHVHVKPDIVLLADVRDGDERVESSVHCSTSGRTHEEWHKALHTHTQRYVCILYTKIYECIRIYLKHSFIAGRLLSIRLLLLSCLKLPNKSRQLPLHRCHGQGPLNNPVLKKLMDTILVLNTSWEVELNGEFLIQFHLPASEMKPKDRYVSKGHRARLWSSPSVQPPGFSSPGLLGSSYHCIKTKTTQGARKGPVIQIYYIVSKVLQVWLRLHLACRHVIPGPFICRSKT